MRVRVNSHHEPQHLTHVNTSPSTWPAKVQEWIGWACRSHMKRRTHSRPSTPSSSVSCVATVLYTQLWSSMLRLAAWHTCKCRNSKMLSTQSTHSTIEVVETLIFRYLYPHRPSATGDAHLYRVLLSRCLEEFTQAPPRLYATGFCLQHSNLVHYKI